MSESSFSVPEGHEGHRFLLRLDYPPRCLTCEQDIGPVMELKREHRGSYGQMERCGYIDPDDPTDPTSRRCRELTGHIGPHDYRSGSERIRDAIAAERGGDGNHALSTIRAWAEAQKASLCDKEMPFGYMCGRMRGHEGDCLMTRYYYPDGGPVVDERPRQRLSWWRRLFVPKELH